MLDNVEMVLLFWTMARFLSVTQMTWNTIAVQSGDIVVLQMNTVIAMDVLIIVQHSQQLLQVDMTHMTIQCNFSYYM